jgi:hypothetical protein
MAGRKIKVTGQGLSKRDFQLSGISSWTRNIFSEPAF